MFLLDVIEEWAEHESGHGGFDRARQLSRLRAEIEHLRDIGYLPENFSPGDLKRSVAEAQVRAIERKAETLGFVRPSQELVIEAGKEIVRGHGGGLGISADGEDDPSSRSPKKSREVDRGLGLGGGPELVTWPS